MKKALITGGTGGIGLGIVDAMLAGGYHVTATGVLDSELNAVTARPNLALAKLDVTDQRQIDQLMSGFDRLDVLVNCAGIIRRGAEYEIETFMKVIDVNLTGTMRMCLAARPKMIAAGEGSIVNIASILSFFGGPLVPAYTASKGGVMQLTKALAVAWAKEGIRVNAIAPGWITTDLTSEVRSDEQRSAAILSRTPMKRWGEAGDLGGVAAFLCSDAARFMTGSILTVDGGFAAM